MLIIFYHILPLSLKQVCIRSRWCFKGIQFTKSMFVLQEKNNPLIEYVSTGWLSGLNQEAARDLMAHGAVGRAELIGNLYAWWMRWW